MATQVTVDKMADTIVEWLTEYSEEVTEIAKDVVDDISEGAMQETKDHITWKDKEYSKAFALKTSFEDKRNKRNTWYVKPKLYGLTHLLEFGHATRNGGRTRAYPHVRYGDDFVKNNFERLLKERIEQCKI